jgi:hypothetical protein
MSNSLGTMKVRTAAREAWGNVNSVKQIVPGVWAVDTWGHGGYLVAVGPNEPFQLDERLQVERFKGAQWTAFGVPVLTFFQFEEDVDYAVLLAAHPEVREASNRWQAGEWAKSGQSYMPQSVEDLQRVLANWAPDFLSVVRR